MTRLVDNLHQVYGGSDRFRSTTKYSQHSYFFAPLFCTTVNDCYGGDRIVIIIELRIVRSYLEGYKLLMMVLLNIVSLFLKSLEGKLVVDGGKVQEIEDKVNKMEDAGVLPRDGFAGTLNDRCNEVRKEQQNVNVAIKEAKPKYVVK